MAFDRMSTLSAVELMLTEEARVTRALLGHRRKIARVVNRIAGALKEGGRLFYVGAGTSGRLGVLDASECPPTFRSDPQQVQGIIAGGERALRYAVEGAEDDFDGGAKEIKARRCGRRDVVVGIAASGTTPFVWGALYQARKQGAATVMVCFNPNVRVPAELKPDVLLAVDLGPEVLTGSTRLKAGTATKLLLNTFTTLSMARQGKVMSNLMVDLNPSNVKLRARAARITAQLAGCTELEATRTLEACGWIVKKAVARLAT
jgi:N-acetylmuramic acid 6-phosphate etherase